MPFNREVILKVAEKVRSLEGDGYLTFDPKECFYLSGLNFSFSVCLVDKDGELLFFTDGRYLGRVGEVEFEVLKWEGMEKLFELLRERGFNSFILDSSRCKASTYEKLSESFSVVSCEGFLDEFREVKTEEEISIISEAVSIAEVSLKNVLHLLKAGTTEKQFRAELIREMFLNGADGEAFPTIVASGKNSAIPHWETSDREIKEGDCVIVDFGVLYRGYVSDITRTFFVGKPPKELLDVYDAVLEAQSIGINFLSPGRAACEVDSKVRSFLERKGYGEYFLHSTGHGIGIEVHEKPTISARSKDVLRKDTVVTVEPGVYIPGVGGVRIEDDCIVTENGGFTISNLEK